MGLNLFRDKVVRSEQYPIQKHLISAMLTQIQLERQGDVIDRSAIQSAVTMLAELKDPTTNGTVYSVDFETEYLEKSASFYQIESEKLVSSYDAPEFMRKVWKKKMFDIYTKYGYLRWRNDLKKNTKGRFIACQSQQKQRFEILLKQNLLQTTYMD